jgi:hypoxanthine phosphoribosyltransferase
LQLIQNFLNINILKSITLDNKRFQLYIAENQINTELSRVSYEITRDFSKKKPLFISLLNGAFVFTSDLLKSLNFDCYVSFVKVSSYEGTSSSGKIVESIGLVEKIENRPVIIIDDIIDTGNTILHFKELLKQQNPSEIKVASMFFKPDACKVSLKIDYLGMMIANRFVVGYGLDYNGLGRNLRDLYIEA